MNEKLHYMHELDDVPREYSRYCERHNYWYWPSKGCYMCIEEGRETKPSLRKLP